MPLRETVELDIRNAQNQLNQLEAKFDALATPISVPIEFGDAPRKLQEIREDLGLTEQSVRQIGSATEGLDQQFGLISSALGVTEDEARELARQIGVSRIQATQLDQSLLEVGKAMGLSESEARQMAREMQRVAPAAQDAADETRRLAREADQAGSKFGQLRTQLTRAAAVLGVGFGIREVIQQFNLTIDAATALTESMNAVEVVFGEGAAAIQAFGEDSAANVGLAASQVNELVTPIGALLQNFGLDGREAADAALELTTRAADLASVFNTDVNDALLAIGSALRGEQEPIRRFGVNLNAAALDAKALELGLVGVGEEVTQSIRGQAAYAEVLEQTAFAAGDFANTADSAANRQRTLSAALEEARATVGTALLPLFEDLLDLMPQLIGAFEDLAPVIGLVADGFGLLVQGQAPLLDLFGQLAADIGRAGDELAGLDPSGVGDVLGDVFRGALTPLGFFVDQLLEVDRFFARGFTNRELEQGLESIRVQAERTSDPVALLENVFEGFTEAGLNAVPVLEQFADAAGLSDEEFTRFIQNLLLARGALQLTNEDVATLRNLLRDLGGDPTGGFGFGSVLGETTPDEIDAARVSLDQFRDSVGLTFDELEAQQTLEDAFGDLPTVVTNFANLQAELDRTGQSLNNFLTDAPEDTGIIGIFDDIETRALETLATLQEVAPELTGTLLGAFGDAPVDEETDKIEDDIQGFFDFLDEKAGERAELEFDLAIIASEAPNLAQFLADQGLAATDIAEAFAANLDDAAQAEALIVGTEGMAVTVAENFASFLETLTPEELANVAVFGAENFVSNPIIEQLGKSAKKMAQVLSDALAAETISPALTLDLSNVQITGAINTGQIPVGPGGGTDTAPIGAQSVSVTINNPVTQDLDTSATQAAQTVGAVASSLPRVE